MAKDDFFVDIDLNNQSLLNAKVQNLASAPVKTSNDKGFIYFNSVDNIFFIWDGTQWVNLSEIYTHPIFAGTGQPSTALTGAKVISRITLNNGHTTAVTTRDMTTADIGAANAAHTHSPIDIVGLAANTFLGNNLSTAGPALTLTVAQVLTMLGISAGTATILNTGTDSSQRTWTAKILADYINSKIDSFISEVNLGTTYTTTNVVITNTAGENAAINAATTSQAGVMSSADKTKLNGIEAGANNYVHPTLNPGTHPFSSNITSGLKVLSQIVVNNLGHVITINGRDITASDIAAVLFNNNVNNGTTTTWSGSKIYDEIQAALAQATTGALSYKGEYDPVTRTPDVYLPATGVKTGWTYVISANGSFVSQEVEVGDMIIAKTDSPLDDPNKWQIVNKNIPAILDASLTVKGIIQLATTAEGIAGTNNTKAITPLVLKAVLDARTGGYSVAFGNGSDTSFVITHGLNTQDVTIQVQRVSDRQVIYVTKKATSATTVTLDMNVAPAANAFRVIIKKY